MRRAASGLDEIDGMRTEADSLDLERLCLAALACGDIEAAFRYADRRCRIPPLADAHHYVLRAEVLTRMNECDGAIADLSRALDIAPDDLPANRRMLTLATGGLQIAAAKVLVAKESDIDILANALSVLRQGGLRAVGSTRSFDGMIVGWAAWDGSARPRLGIRAGKDIKPVDLTIDGEPNHPLGACGYDHVASFELPRQPSSQPQRLTLSLRGQDFCSLTIAPNARPPDNCKPDIDGVRAGRTPEITIIIPIYRDFAATQACMESVKREVSAWPGCHAILVNDATPEPEIAVYLTTFANDPSFTVLSNGQNLGFVGSVNRALLNAPEGDVILLNADTLVPLGALRRLASAARLDPAIGTATPLSNNGEFTSFPVPFRSNPLGSEEDVIAIDRTAAKVNEDLIIDMPNGVGFCLFVSDRCRRSLGLLTDVFQRGYLEDVDYCLRAREDGFRNVCIPSVYVGHVGSRSFLTDKRALVVRNLGVLENKYPDYRQDCAAFMKEDQLRGARAAIELALPPKEAFDRMIVTGPGLVGEIVKARADDLSHQDLPVLIMTIGGDYADAHITLRHAADQAPQSLRFRLEDPRDNKALHTYLHSLKLTAVEIADPAKVPPSLMLILLGLDLPLDLFVADVESLSALGMVSAGGIEPKPNKGLLEDRINCARVLINKANRILVPTAAAEALVSQILPFRIPILIEQDRQPVSALQRAERKSRRKKCGIVPLGVSAGDLRQIQLLARCFRKRDPAARLFVIGRTLDDEGLMAIGNLFVTGAVPAPDFADLFRLYDLDHAFLPVRRPLYGHPVVNEVIELGLPTAYFDWSFGAVESRVRDLSLDPRLSDAVVADTLVEWMR